MLQSMSVPTCSKFHQQVTNGTAPLSVQFNDASTGSPTSWSWEFGDGNTSSKQNPIHTYYTSGTFTVTLTASNAKGTDTFNQKLVVNPSITSISPNHGPCNNTTDVTIIGNGFTGGTTGVTGVYFGSIAATNINVINDTTINVTSPAQPHSTVNITVHTLDGSSAIVPADQFTYDAEPFVITPSKIRISDNVYFDARQSVDITHESISSWEFGDGTPVDTSGDTVVSHNYSEVGQYTVNLTIKDSTGAVSTESQRINVTIPVVLVHGWDSNSDVWKPSVSKI